MKQNYLFLSFIVCLYSCQTTKSSLAKALRRDIYWDTSFFKLEIPLITSSGLSEITSPLEDAGYLELISKKLVSGVSSYSLTDKSKPFVQQIFTNKDSETVAYFNYYKLRKIKLDKIVFKSPAKDSVSATFSSEYTVVPMFKVKSNPKHFNVEFKKLNGVWVVSDKRSTIINIYRNELQTYLQNLIFIWSDRYKKWKIENPKN